MRDRQCHIASISHVVNALARKVNFSYPQTCNPPPTPLTFSLPLSHPLSISIHLCVLCFSLFTVVSLNRFSLKGPPAERKCFVSAGLYALLETGDRNQGARLCVPKTMLKVTGEWCKCVFKFYSVRGMCCICSILPGDALKKLKLWHSNCYHHHNMLSLSFGLYSLKAKL